MDSNPVSEGAVMEDHNVTLIVEGVRDLGMGSGDMPKDKLSNDKDKGTGANNVFVTELIQSRVDALKRKRRARRAAWLEEVEEELGRRAEYMREMEGIPPDQIGDRDKQRMSNVSCEWREQFQSQRTRFLFKEVFPVLWKNSFKDIADSDELHHAALSAVLRCRSVSHSWKDSIDERLSLHNATAKSFTEGLPHCAPNLDRMGYLIFFNDHWSDQMYRGGRNPFFTRQFIGGSSMTGRRFKDLQYWNELEKMFRRWGGELWTLSLEGVFDKDSWELKYVFLTKFLSCTPNLRKLIIIGTERAGQELQQNGFAPFEERMAKNPLPELPHLRAIEFGGFVPRPLILAALAKYGRSLESIDFYGMGHDKFQAGYMDPGEFISKRPLPLPKYTCRYGYTPQISHWNFRDLFLNELELAYINVEEGAEVGNIFGTVSSCGSTLRQLRLGFNFQVPTPAWLDRLPEGAKLELPHLEMLDITVIQSKISNVDFLLPLVSLKELSFTYNAGKSDNSVRNGKGLIQFAGYRDQLYESNLWKLLPELRRVELKTHPILESSEVERVPKKVTVYSRDGFRKHSDIFGSN